MEAVPFETEKKADCVSLRLCEKEDCSILYA